MTPTELERYKKNVTNQLSELTPYLQRFALGDFSQEIPIPEKEDEFTELFVGISLMAEDFKAMLQKLEAVQDNLQAEKDLLEKIINGLPGIFYLFDAQGKFKRWNKNFETVSGYSTQEMAAAHPSEFFVGEEKALVAERIQQTFVEGQAFVEANFTHKDGSQTPYYLSGVLIDLEGEPHLMGMGIDISNLVQARKKLRQSEERFRVIFERSTVGKSLTAPDGKLFQINQSFADMLGYSLEEMQAINFAEITHPDDIAESKECIRSLLAGEQDTYRMEKRYLHKNGEIVWADVSTALFRDAKGEPLHFMTSIIDITPRKRAEEEREQYVHQIERFNRLAIGREQRMIELKREVNVLAEELDKEPPYDVSFAQ